VNTDLPDDPGIDPGVEQLLRTLTAAPTAHELAAEQQALTMFRSSQHPTAQLAVTPAPAPPRAWWRWRLALAGGAFAALVGGVAGAAYAAALPAPVQNFASRSLGFLGVPAAHPVRHSHTPLAGRTNSPAGHHRTSPAPTAPTTPATVSRHSRRSGSPSPAPSATAELLSAVPSAAHITAGGPVTIAGSLTRSGSGVSGATVVLLERPAGSVTWKVAGSGRTASGGNVTVHVSALVTNAVFRLTGPDRAVSPAVRITVSPPVMLQLHPGARAIRDVLVVSTQFADPGNVVVLQVQSANGGWAGLRVSRLNAHGRARFVLDARMLKNKMIRVKLSATLRHAASVSSPLTVPPPA
jgi:hypothetical protein